MSFRDHIGERRRPPSTPFADGSGRPARRLGDNVGLPLVTAPGAFVEEVPSRSRAIQGASTSIAGFVGAFMTGPLDVALPIAGMIEFEQEFGAVRSDDETGHAVSQFFRNGGRLARVVRVAESVAAVPQLPDAATLIGDPGAETGVFALGRHRDIGIVVIPGAVADHMTSDDTSLVYGAALEVCEDIGAFLIVDVPERITAVDEAGPWIESVHVRHRNAAAYFPRLRVPDVSSAGGSRSVGAGGSVAGIYARIDAARGVWQAPAGGEARFNGVSGLTTTVDDAASAVLNPTGVNGLRLVPGRGPLVWGARTLIGVDGLDSEWKYVSVRRTALFLEKSLDAGLGWAAFEPSTAALWAEIRSVVSEFMQTLFRQGAFQGSNAAAAYFVKCDSSTTTAADQQQRIVNLVVGFAPLRPAEFVVIELSIEGNESH